MANAFGALNIASPVGTEQVRADNTGSVLAYVYASQLRDAAGYSKNAPTSGATLTFGNNQSIMEISGSGTISALTVSLPLAPVDGQRALIFANQAVSTLTLQLNPSASGQTLNNAVTALSQNVAVEYLYSLSNLTWDRIQ